MYLTGKLTTSEPESIEVPDDPMGSDVIAGPTCSSAQAGKLNTQVTIAGKKIVQCFDIRQTRRLHIDKYDGDRKKVQSRRSLDQNLCQYKKTADTVFANTSKTSPY